MSLMGDFYVQVRRIISRSPRTMLYPVGTHSLRPAIFAASSGCAAPPQSHIAPFCPQQSCCGLFCAYTHYLLSSVKGMDGASVVLLEQIKTIDKRRVVRYIGRVSREQMDGVNEAIQISLGLYIPEEMEAP